MGHCGRCHSRFTRKELETVSIINSLDVYDFENPGESINEVLQSWTDYYCKNCINEFNKLMKIFINQGELNGCVGK